LGQDELRSAIGAGCAVKPQRRPKATAANPPSALRGGGPRSSRKKVNSTRPARSSSPAIVQHLHHPECASRQVHPPAGTVVNHAGGRSGINGNPHPARHAAPRRWRPPVPERPERFGRCRSSSISRMSCRGRCRFCKPRFCGIQPSADRMMQYSARVHWPPIAGEIRSKSRAPVT